jgi:PKD repeat protein
MSNHRIHSWATSTGGAIVLTVTDVWGKSSTASRDVTITEPASNNPPTAVIASVTCSALTTCALSATGSSDPDSATGDGIRNYRWNWGDGTPDTLGTSASQSHVFPVAGTYTVTLIVEDNAGGTSSTSRQITVAPLTLPGNHSFELSGRVLVQQSRHVVRLTWTGAAGSLLDLYRNNQRRERTNNDGLYIRTVGGPRGTSLTYRVCERGTARCSNDVTVILEGSSISLTATGRLRNGREEATLRWSGAGLTAVDVYRNSARIARTSNDGLYVSSRTRSAGASAVAFRVCERGTSNCSNTASVTFR